MAIYFGLKDDPDAPPDRAEIRASARTLLRSPSAWLILLCVGAGIGAVYEGAAAILGDGEFNLEDVPRGAGPAILGPAGALVVQALLNPT